MVAVLLLSVACARRRNALRALRAAVRAAAATQRHRRVNSALGVQVVRERPCSPGDAARGAVALLPPERAPGCRSAVPLLLLQALPKGAAVCVEDVDPRLRAVILQAAKTLINERRR